MIVQGPVGPDSAWASTTGVYDAAERKQGARTKPRTSTHHTGSRDKTWRSSRQKPDSFWNGRFEDMKFNSLAYR